MSTIYSNYSNVQLFELFSAENWHSEQTTDERRQQALQELSDRTADENGTLRVPVRVSAETPPFGGYNYIKGIISLNDGFINRGQAERPDAWPAPIKASNIRAMATIFHENEHVHQRAFIEEEGKEGQELQLQRDMKANLDGYNYIRPGTDYDLYRIQLCEREANRIGDQKTMEAMKLLAQQHGGRNDANLKDFAGEIERSYQRSLAEAQYRYKDPNIEQTMQRAMNDITYQNRAISENMPASYYQIRFILAGQEVDSLTKQLKEHPEMDRGDTERLENTLRDRFHEMENLEKELVKAEALSAEDSLLNAEHQGPGDEAAIETELSAPSTGDHSSNFEAQPGEIGAFENHTADFGMVETADTDARHFMPCEESGVGGGTGNSAESGDGGSAGDDDGSAMSM